MGNVELIRVVTGVCFVLVLLFLIQRGRKRVAQARPLRIIKPPHNLRRPSSSNRHPLRFGLPLFLPGGQPHRVRVLVYPLSLSARRLT
jgi:hypothetical protein